MLYVGSAVEAHHDREGVIVRSEKTREKKGIQQPPLEVCRDATTAPVAAGAKSRLVFHYKDAVAAEKLSRPLSGGKQFPFISPPFALFMSPFFAPFAQLLRAPQKLP